MPKACKTQKQKINDTKRRNRYYAVSAAFNLIMKDMDRDEVISIVSERFNYAESTSTEIYQQAMKSVERWKSMDTETIKSRNLQRLDKLVNDTIDDNDRNNLIKAIDLQNKTAGVYVDKKDVNISGDVISFKFGND